jgi:hypothetical protein
MKTSLNQEGRTDGRTHARTHARTHDEPRGARLLLLLRTCYIVYLVPGFRDLCLASSQNPGGFPGAASVKRNPDVTALERLPALLRRQLAGLVGVS